MDAQKKCNRLGCDKPAVKGRVYCCREHSPLGLFGFTKDEIEIQKKYKKSIQLSEEYKKRFQGDE